MAIIYHLTTPTGWQQSPGEDYQASSLATEGFIHCSSAGQLAPVANTFYADAADLLVLHIDTANLASPVKEEPTADGETFPHIYGAINRSAVFAVTPLRRGADGLWAFP